MLRSGEHEQGNFYVLDEAGVQFSRRTWQERGRILANQALQLVRDHNLDLIFTLPRLGELDSQAQGRLQVTLELVEKEPGEYVGGKWKWFDPDRMDETGRIYKKYPRRPQGGVTKRIPQFRFCPPSAELTEPYEKRKRAFQGQFYEQAISALEGEEKGDESEESPQDPREIAEEIADNGIDQYRFTANNGREYIDADMIELDYGLSARKAKQVKKLVARSDEGGEANAQTSPIYLG